MRGPSPLTTVQILKRACREIIINTPEEAAQIADCCTYGTFPHFFENVASRIRQEALTIPGAEEILYKWDSAQWENLRELIQQSQATA